MVIVEKIEGATIFKVSAALGDEAVNNIKQFISSMEVSSGEIKPSLDVSPYGEGFDKDGFVTDPLVLSLAKDADQRNWATVKERFCNF